MILDWKVMEKIRTTRGKKLRGPCSSWLQGRSIRWNRSSCPCQAETPKARRGPIRRSAAGHVQKLARRRFVLLSLPCKMTVQKCGRCQRYSCNHCGGRIGMARFNLPIPPDRGRNPVQPAQLGHAFTASSARTVGSRTDVAVRIELPAARIVPNPSATSRYRPGDCRQPRKLNSDGRANN
jgi:hypothetical protein